VLVILKENSISKMQYIWDSPCLCSSSHKLPCIALVTLLQCKGFKEDLLGAVADVPIPEGRKKPRPLPEGRPLASAAPLTPKAGGGWGALPGGLGDAGGPGTRAPGGGGGGGPRPGGGGGGGAPRPGGGGGGGGAPRPGGGGGGGGA